MPKRVVITGMGLISPIGSSVEDFWNNLKNGVHGFGPITKFDASDFKAKIVAEVKDFNPELYISKKETKRMDLFCQYAMAAAKLAIESSGLTEEDINGNRRMGVIIGSGIGGIGTIEEQVVRLSEKGPGRVAPLFIPMAIINMAAGNVALQHGFKGICSSIVTACASGTNSVGEAFRNIQNGFSDVILAGGCEAGVTRLSIAGFANLTALSLSENPDRASIPFDKDRNGFVMGEGAGILILEELEHAKKRGAEIYAEVVGYGSTCDAYHMTAPDPEGSGAAEAMSLAISDAGISPEDIDYINAHGTSTDANDLPETMAIKTALGSHAYKVPVTSTKSMTGHLLGAAGAVEAIATVCSIRSSFIHPTIGLESPGEGCDLNYVPNKGISKEIKYALSNSFGFGGHNAVICIKKWEE